MSTATFKVTGMSCGHCEAAVIAEVTPLAGVERVEVDVAGGLVTVSGSVGIDEAGVRTAIEEAGYAVVS